MRGGPGDVYVQLSQKAVLSQLTTSLGANTSLQGSGKVVHQLGIVHRSTTLMHACMSVCVSAYRKSCTLTAKTYEVKCQLQTKLLGHHTPHSQLAVDIFLFQTLTINSVTWFKALSKEDN
jgi:hypothetical protein